MSCIYIWGGCSFYGASVFLWRTKPLAFLHRPLSSTQLVHRISFSLLHSATSLLNVSKHTALLKRFLRKSKIGLNQRYFKTHVELYFWGWALNTLYSQLSLHMNCHLLLFYKHFFWKNIWAIHHMNSHLLYKALSGASTIRVWQLPIKKMRNSSWI